MEDGSLGTSDKKIIELTEQLAKTQEERDELMPLLRSEKITRNHIIERALDLERELAKYKETPNVSFVVIAFRYGGLENTFPIGSFTTLAAAEKAAADHRMFRGGKYEHRIYQFENDKLDDDIGHATNRLPCINHNPSAASS